MSKIYIAGHKGLVGSAIIRFLNDYTGHRDIITRAHSELDLTNQTAVNDFFKKEKPEYIVLAAAKVGGILANSTYPADFIRDNLLIQTNVIEAAKKFGCKKFCFLGSSCIYPQLCPQPIKEEYLLSSPLEKSNIAYAIAKIAGVQMIRAYREQYNFPGYCLMPTNLFGPNDNFDLRTSHALPALIRKFHEAKLNNDFAVTVWGNGGIARREFLYVDDLAEVIVATLFSEEILNKEVPDLMNVGVGEDISIHELALLIKEKVGFCGEIVYDRTKLDGTPKKLLDISKMTALGLKPKVSLQDGIEITYDWFLKNYSFI